MKKLIFNCHDFGMFDGELNIDDYGFFVKHTGAFKRLITEEAKEQKQRFLDAFCEFFLNHGEMKTVTTVVHADHKKKFVDSFRQYAIDTFVKGKFSSAKQFVNDSFVVAKNKHMIQYMDSQSYAKDPFFHKDTREVFRRLFGDPSEAGTCVKAGSGHASPSAVHSFLVICLLPLYIRFAGAVCRYLRRWLEANETTVSKSKNKKKGDDDEEDTPSVMVFKIDRGGVQEIRRTRSGGHKITHIEDSAYLKKAGFPWPQMARSADSVDYELQKQRRIESEWLTQRLDEEQIRMNKEQLKEWQECQRIGYLRELSKKNSKTTNSKEASVSKGVGENFGGVSSGAKLTEIETLEGKSSEVKTAESKTPDEKVLEEKRSEKTTSGEKTSEKMMPTESLSENGGNDDGGSSDACDDLYIKEKFPELHLGKPHPNVVYDNMVEEEKKRKEKSSRALSSGNMKFHLCAFCKRKEDEPMSYKKCGKCKGSGTKFYCSQRCQRRDWPNHQLQHQKFKRSGRKPAR